MDKANFEEEHKLFEKAIGSESYKELIGLIEGSNKVFIIANGGLGYVAAHWAADMSRLTNKAVYSFDSAGFITSNANDHGWEEVFTRWLETMVFNVEDPWDTLIIGLSCSGRSVNVINALHEADKRDYPTFFITGIETEVAIPSLSFGTSYFHTTEILCIKLFYDLVHKLGNHCPEIESEIERKSEAGL